MADHIRKQLRDAVVTALAGLATTGAHVYAGRTWPIPETVAAALLVYAEGGTSQFDAMSSGMGDPGLALLRLERLSILAVVRSRGAEPEDTLHQIAAEIEPALMSNAALGGLLLARELITTEITGRAEQEDRFGEMKLTYALTVRTTAGDPTQPL